MRIGCLQMKVAKGDPGSNLEKVRIFSAKAREEKVEILLLPEMWSSGFAYREMERLAGETPALLAELGRLASEGGMAIAGSMPEADCGKVHNTLFVVGADGSVKAAYRKVHLFPPFKEEMFLAQGTKLVGVHLQGLNVGLAVCFDLRFPETFRKLSLRGARLILVSAQWPMERLDHWRVLVRARAMENQVFVAAANAAGRTGATSFAGHSLVVDPAGSILAEGGEKEELLTAEVDPAQVDLVRKEVNYLSCRVRDTDEFLTIL